MLTLVDMHDPDIWIADSGASMHTTPYITGMMELSTLTSEIDVATGPVAKQGQVGKLRGQVIQQNGDKIQMITLQHVTHLPSGCHNLWSISKMLHDGWKMTGDYDTNCADQEWNIYCI